MKSLISVISIILLVSCINENIGVETKSETTSTRENSENIVDFDWLLGNWQRSNEKEDKETYETWNKKNDSEYRGFGFTIQNKDTIWKENIKLIQINNAWNFEVVGAEDTLTTVFKLIEIENERFVCENQENEFPKHIEYFKEGEKIRAIISGGGMEVPFDFERID